MRIYWIDEFEKGAIGMMARPKGGEWLENEIAILKNTNIDCVVCLIEYHEMLELNIEKEEFYCNENNIEFIHFPIKDYSLPKKNKYLDLIEDINERLKLNQKIVIHCRMGIGRTSTVTAGVLIKNNIHIEDVFEFISLKRTIEVPDTEEQKEWVLSLMNKLG